jgi:hypothetical protein
MNISSNLSQIDGFWHHFDENLKFLFAIGISRGPEIDGHSEVGDDFGFSGGIGSATPTGYARPGWRNKIVSKF